MDCGLRCVGCCVSAAKAADRAVLVNAGLSPRALTVHSPQSTVLLDFRDGVACVFDCLLDTVLGNACLGHEDCVLVFQGNLH